jgi:hypothetical protein
VRVANYELLPDRWHSRDFPVLLDIARRLDGGAQDVRLRQVSEETGQRVEDLLAAVDSLVPGYLDAGSIDTDQGRYDYVVTGVTERGRRAVGLWPSGESADALVDALRQAEEATEDPEEKGILRRAAGAVGMVSRDVMVDVMAAVIARQSGLG